MKSNFILAFLVFYPFLGGFLAWLAGRHGEALLKLINGRLGASRVNGRSQSPGDNGSGEQVSRAEKKRLDISGRNVSETSGK